MCHDTEKWGIIYHPKAGTRKAKKRWKEIQAYIESKGIAYDYLKSEGYGSVERLTKILADNGYRTIVIVGGDGALNDAINGIMHSDVPYKSKICLGIIPNGIGNDFAKYWGMTTDYKEAVDTIIHHRIRKIDVGKCSFYDGKHHVTRYFINAVNIGMGADILKIIDETKRFWGIPSISYFAALVSLVFKRKLHRMHFIVNDEHIKGRIMSVCIGNTIGYGQAPNAIPYNGLLDVSVIYRPELLQLLSGMWMLVRGHILNHKVIKAYRTKHVTICKAQNTHIALDGRLLENHFPLKIGILTETISLIIPK